MRRLATIVALGLVSVGLSVASAPPAPAAATTYDYAAYTGGTYLKLLDGTVNSDFTAQSSVSGGPTSGFSKNSTAAADIDGLLRVGAVETRTRATVEPTKTTLKSFARTANVNLLGGLITADAVETVVSTVGRADDTTGSTGGTKLVDLEIVGIDLPVVIPKNYSVTIPGVANVSLNYHATGKQGTTVATFAWAIGITLIKPRDGYPAGVTLLVNPVNQYLVESEPSSGATLFGGAYGTRVQVEATDRIRIISDRTAFIATPAGSSGGQTLRNQTLGVDVPGVLTTSEVTSTTWSTKDGNNAEVRNTNQIADLNILNGLITADAIKVTAYGKLQDGQWTGRLKMTTLNLVIAGQQIPIDVGPNTNIDVAGLGLVSINQQNTIPVGAPQNSIFAIRITLDTARAGLPVGAVIEVGAAGTLIGIV